MTEHEKALISLLDDPSPTVQNALREEFKRLGLEHLAFLEQVAKGQNLQLAEAARVWLAEFGQDDPVDAFIQFIRSFSYELETGSLLLDRTVYPNIDPTEYCLFLDTMAARAKELIMLPCTAWEQCKQLNRVIFHEYGFCGDVENYYNPLNSYLHQVIKRRRGIPLSLSVLYILVAERCGIHLEPIALPGHFLVGCFLDSDAFFIDPYMRGTFRSTEDVYEILEERGLEPDPHYLMPAPVGEVICRGCRNLVNQYTQSGNVEHSRVFARFVREFESTYARHAQS